jgi:PAS domain S-box-containing protein
LTTVSGVLSRVPAGRRWRTVGVGAFLALALLVFIALASIDPAKAHRRLFDNIHWTLSYIIAATLAWIGLRANRGNDSEVPLRWFAAALSTSALAQLLWDVEVWFGWNFLPSPSDTLYVLLGPFCCMAYISAMRQRHSWRELRPALMDVLGLAVATLTFALVIYLPRQSSSSLLQMIMLIAYPVGIGSAVGLGFIMPLQLQLPPRPGRTLMLLGLAGQTWIWLEWNARTLDDALVDGGLYNASFSLCVLAMGVATLFWEINARSSARWSQIAERLERLLPLFMVMISCAAIVMAASTSNISSLARSTAVWGGVVVVIVASARQALILTERQRFTSLERSLRMRDEAYRLLVEQAVDGIFVGSTKGIIVDVNRRGAALLGRDRDSLIGEDLLTVISPEYSSGYLDDMRRLTAGEEIRAERSVIRADGNVVDVEVHAKLLSDGRVQAIWRDISERKRLEEQLRQRQKLEAVGTLAAGIAHDFNNLLMTIRGNATLATQDVLPQQIELKSSLDEIQRAAGRGSQLVGQIMAFSRPTKAAKTSVQLRDVVQEVVSLLRATLPSGVELMTRLDPDVPPVLADSAQMHQVLVNLCTNAWQAMAGRTGHIQIRLSREVAAPPGNLAGSAVYACLVVEDSGTGMDEATRARVFEPFFTTKRASGGTGMGLAVVHGIVRSHGGSIQLDSAPEHGTTVRIMLPVLQADQLAEPEVAPSPGKRYPLTGCRILFVDDEPAIADLVARDLSRRGLQVTTRTSPLDALDLAAAQPRSFDVVISDLHMPNLSGLELLGRVRDSQPGARRILVSGMLEPHIREAAAASGIDRVVGKPVSIEELVAALEILLAPP